MKYLCSFLYIYSVWNLLGFLNPWIEIFHKCCKILIHYLFMHSSASFLHLWPQLPFFKPLFLRFFSKLYILLSISLWPPIQFINPPFSCFYWTLYIEFLVSVPVLSVTEVYIDLFSNTLAPGEHVHFPFYLIEYINHSYFKV